jgi:hypothetical protein
VYHSCLRFSPSGRQPHVLASKGIAATITNTCSPSVNQWVVVSIPDRGAKAFLPNSRVNRLVCVHANETGLVALTGHTSSCA